VLWSEQHTKTSKAMFKADQCFEIMSIMLKLGCYKDALLKVWQRCGRPAKLHMLLGSTEIMKIMTPG
jgi:hypothetical protein